MKNLSIITAVLLILASCAGEQKDSSIEAKQAELEKSRKELSELKAKITSLEKEIDEARPESANNNAILVTTFAVERKSFEHFVQLRGTVKSRRNVSLSAQAGGKIQRVHVKEGQRVTQGQVLVTLDTEILRNSISELETQLDLATTTFEKQDRLWKQKIGTEMQYLQAKNQKESLEKRLATTRSQLDQLVVRAPFTGTIDRVDALEGQVTSPGVPLVRIVNPDDTFVQVDVPENYIGRFNAGENASVYFSAQDKTLTSKIISVSQVINAENRTFQLEISLPKGTEIKPNQVGVVTVRDYLNPQAYTVPTRLIQRDNNGQYIYVAADKDSKKVAKRLYVKPGMSHEGFTEVLEGLSGNELVVDEGFRDVSEGLDLSITKSKDQAVAENQQ